MGQKVYTLPITSTAIGTAVQDICSLVTGASNGIKIRHIHLDANVSAEAALRIRLKRGTGVTQGSGGSVATSLIQPTDVTDPALVGVIAHFNDTSQATGTFVELGEFYWDVSLPFDHVPVQDEDRETCTVSQALVIDLPATITSTTIAGYIKFQLLP